jgi:RNA polymerase sigma-70 factor (ECF subfamily)
VSRPDRAATVPSNAVDEITRLALDAAGGDRIALNGFVRATQAEVWRLCAHLGDPSSADDLTQDTYIRAFRALPAFRGDSSARTWLLAIARRTVADAIRTASRRRRLLGRLEPSRPVPDHGGAITTRALIARLDTDQRAAFVLTQLLGLSYAAAAEVCDCPVGTIRSRVARARGALIGSLVEDGAASSPD